MKQGIKIIFYSTVCFLFGGIGFGVSAATADTTVVSPRTKLDSVAGSSGVGLNGNFSNLTGTIIEAVLAATALVFLVMVLYAGLLWLMAQGDTAKIQKAKVLLIWSILGVVVMFLAYGITRFVFFDILLNDASTGSSSYYIAH
jgi:hypothetical protein